MIPLSVIEDYRTDQSEGMRNLITWFLNLVRQLGALQQTDADRHERTASRTGHRNDNRDRSFRARYGDVTLTKPQFPYARVVCASQARMSTRTRAPVSVTGVPAPLHVRVMCHVFPSWGYRIHCLYTRNMCMRASGLDCDGSRSSRIVTSGNDLPSDRPTRK